MLRQMNEGSSLLLTTNTGYRKRTTAPSGHSNRKRRRAHSEKIYVKGGIPSYGGRWWSDGVKMIVK